MKKILLISFAALAVLAGCKKDNTGGNGNQGGGDEYVAATSVRIEGNPGSLVLTQGEPVQLSIVLTPENATPNISWSASNPEEVLIEGADQKTVTVTGLINGHSPEITCTVTNKKDGDPTVPEVSVNLNILPKAVDLGLSVKWASANLGAKDENDHGWHIAWGETAEKNNYSLNPSDESQRNKWWSGSAYTKYTSPVNLDSTDDAVMATFSGANSSAVWKTPIAADFQELIDNSLVSKIYNDDASRIIALKFISTKPGHTNDFIILPYANVIEYAADGAQRNTLAYWSATVDQSDYTKAKILGINNSSDPVVSSWARCNGLAIRPVLR